MVERAFSVRRMPGFTPMAILVFIMLYAPIAILAAYSFNAGTSLAIWEGFSLRWYASAWQNTEVQVATFRSLGIATAAGDRLLHPGHHGSDRHHAHGTLPRPDRGAGHDQPAADGARDRHRHRTA